MSRRNDDGMAALGCLVLLALPFVWIYNQFKTPTFEKIRALDTYRPQTWGTEIRGQVCPNCKIIGEAGRRSCHGCGMNLKPLSVTKNQKIDDENTISPEAEALYKTISIIIIIALFLFFILISQ